MSAGVGNQNARSSPSDVIDTFNHFFMNVPTNKSFDMSYKVYIRDLCDTEDRTISASNSSAVQSVGKAQPVTIASHGTVPPMSSSSLSAIPSTKTSATNLTLKTLASTKNDSVTTSHIERLCEENMNRKARSMVDLSDFNDQYGFRPPPPSATTPPTVYENLSSIKKKKPAISPAPSTFTKENFGRLVESDAEQSGSDAGPPLLIKVSDCFD